jgi:multidrug efflux pump subunit AcrA (membrane-fusion protein)
LARLKLIDDQIAKCVIRAPRAGQVVYANDSYRGIEIQEGLLVRERQVIIRLPDPLHMQVVAKINESRVDRVKSGMKALVKIDAMPDVELNGTVRRVSEYPLPTNSYTAHVKDYATEVEIDVPVEGIRPGMTAEVSILVEHDPQALQVPLQAVFERRGAFWCLTAPTEGGLEVREVDIGSANDRFVVVRAGLTADDQVVIHPSAHLDGVALPAPRLALARQERRRMPIAAATAADGPVEHQVHKIVPDAAGNVPAIVGGGR